MSRFRRCQRCHKRGQTSVVDMETMLLFGKLKVTWRLCPNCFAPMAEQFNQAANAMADATDERLKTTKDAREAVA